VIVLDTSILVYAKGADHPYREPCRALVRLIQEGRVDATTMAEAIQEFVHVRSRRRTGQDAVALARSYARLLSPLIAADEGALERGLRLFERHPGLSAFDAVLAATAIEAGAEALISGNASFSEVKGLRWIGPAGRDFRELVGE
jgi:predicted nucleic acid-binding protein